MNSSKIESTLLRMLAATRARLTDIETAFLIHLESNYPTNGITGSESPSPLRPETTREPALASRRHRGSFSIA